MNTGEPVRQHFMTARPDEGADRNADRKARGHF